VLMAGPGAPRVDVHMDDATFLSMLEQDVRRGLGSRPRWLPPKYFYDHVGSTLFERITELPEYYLTRVEDALLQRLAPDIVRALRPADVLELGPGSGRKVRVFLDAAATISRRLRYVPLDVGRDGLRHAVAGLSRDYPWLRVHAVVGDFDRHLGCAPPPTGRRLALFLGSTIGNFDRPAAVSLLGRIADALGADGRLLVGVDLVKDRQVLEAAYDDRAGVTAAFNRNVLHVLNRALDGDFLPEAYRHRAVYDAAASRIEMHLIATAPQRVHLKRLGMLVDFAAGEGIWTESSYKFTRASAAAILAEAGLGLEAWYTDEAEQFALALARPEKGRARRG
jgi:L-histidine N-alpha-methyltransferase